MPLQMRLKKDRQPWMTLKVTDNRYGRLSKRQLGFLLTKPTAMDACVLKYLQ